MLSFSGIGSGSLSTLCNVVVPNYFTRRRGRAIAIMNLGVGVGRIGLPPLITLLQETFADRGATLVYSGLMLHSCLAATTFHPVQKHMKPSLERSAEKGCQHTKPHSNPKKTNSMPSRKPSIFARVSKSIISDLGVLRSRRAFIITVAWSLFVCSALNFLMIMPFALQDAGFSLDFSALCLSSLGASNFIARTLSPVLSDHRFFKIRVFYVAGFVVMAATTAGEPHSSTTSFLPLSSSLSLNVILNF